MSKFSAIIKSFTLKEIDVDENMREAIRLSVEVLLLAGASLMGAIQQSSMIVRAYDKPIVETEEFARIHPMNRVRAYDTPSIFLAHYSLMLAAKAGNLHHIRAERSAGVGDRVEIACLGDERTCSLCRERAEKASITVCTYATVPPFHVGCRCGVIVRGRGTDGGANG